MSMWQAFRAGAGFRERWERGAEGELPPEPWVCSPACASLACSTPKCWDYRGGLPPQLVPDSIFLNQEDRGLLTPKQSPMSPALFPLPSLPSVSSSQFLLSWPALLSCLSPPGLRSSTCPPHPHPASLYPIIKGTCSLRTRLGRQAAYSDR